MRDEEKPTPGDICARAARSAGSDTRLVGDGRGLESKFSADLVYRLFEQRC
jgi:hypothetical protein